MIDPNEIPKTREESLREERRDLEPDEPEYDELDDNIEEWEEWRDFDPDC